MSKYYRLVRSFSELVGETGMLRLPQYIREEFVYDEPRSTAVRRAIDALREGKNVLIVGPAGVGKTALMAVILDKLLSLGMSIGYVVEWSGRVLREHLEKGVVLFCDDIPRYPIHIIRSIAIHRISGIIATARVEELDDLKRKLGCPIEEIFMVIKIGKMRDRDIRQILMRFAYREGIQIVPEAVDIAVKKAQSLPIYIWQIIRDLKIQGKSILTKEFAKKVPEGMLSYVDSILWRILNTHPDRYALLLTLLIVSDLPRYEINIDVLNTVFAESLRILRSEEVTIAEAVLNEIYANILRYMVRVDKYTYKLPHDSWGDVLRGRGTGPVSAEISRINTLFPRVERLKILRSAVVRAIREAVPTIASSDRLKAINDYIARLNAFLEAMEVPAELGGPVVEKLIYIYEGKLPSSEYTAKKSPLYRSIIDNSVLWNILGLSRTELAEKVRFVLEGKERLLVYPKSDVLTLRHKFAWQILRVYQNKIWVLLTNILVAISLFLPFILFLLIVFYGGYFVIMAFIIWLLSLVALIGIAPYFELKGYTKKYFVVEELIVQGRNDMVKEFVEEVIKNVDKSMIRKIMQDKEVIKELVKRGIDPSELSVWLEE